MYACCIFYSTAQFAGPRMGRTAMKKPIPAIPLVATGAAPQSAAAPASSAQFPLPGWPLFRLGFRPFYLGAAAFALFAVPYWIAGLLGWVALPSTMPPLLWHAHEMLYGFAVAVIVGFLLTAGKAWTGLATPRGATLAVMAGLWLAARLAAVGRPTRSMPCWTWCCCLGWPSC
jgi:uncharacterized protein involved in response to NO